MLWALFEISVNGVEASIVIDFLIKYLKLKDESNTVLKHIISTVLFSGIITVTNFSGINELLAVALNLIGLIVFSFVYLKGKPLSKVFICTLAIILTVLVNSVLIMLLGGVMGVPVSVLLQKNSLRVICIFLTKLVYFYITRIILKIRNKDESFVKNSDWLILLINPIVSIVAISETMYLALFHLEEKASFSVFAIVICTLLVNIITYVLYFRTVKNSKALIENQLLKQQSEYQREHINEVKSLYSQIQIIRHDMKNHLLCVLGLLENDKTEQAKEYLNREVSEITKTKQYVETDDEVVNCIINGKLTKAADLGIKVSFQIMKEAVNIEQYDITVILSNILDNAIEACANSENEDKRIEISIERAVGFTVIKVMNTVSGDVLKSNPEFMTTKDNKGIHGYGIRSCKNIISKYNGKITYTQEDNEFTCNVVFEERE